MTSAPVGFALLDTRLRFVRLNPVLAALHGLPVEAHLGRTPGELIPGLGQDADAFLQRILETGAPVLNVEGRTETPAQPGVLRDFLTSYFPVKARDGSIAFIGYFVFEVSELVQARLRAERAEYRVKAITDNATLGLLMMDERQHCVFMNPAAEDIIGFTLAQVQGQALHEFIHHTRPDGTPYPMAECPIDRALPTRNQTQGEDVFVRRDGSFYPVAFTASPLLQDGRPVGTVIELRDTTEEKREQAERERLLRELQRAVEVREEFLSVASHELKTPLTPLSLKLQSLAKEAERQPDSDFVRKVRRSVDTGREQVRRLGALIGDMLDVSRIQSGRMTLEREEVDLAGLLREVAGRFEEQAARVRSELRVQAPRPVVGQWDRSRLEQVVTNLVDNALKYGPGMPVELRLQARGDRAVLSVTDQGIGIEAGNLARIFNRFERAVSERNYGGLGLGLYISREIVEALGGTIRVESQPSVRTTFTVELPLGPGAA
jgi:PAS domain S-box-containing protein